MQITGGRPLLTMYHAIDQTEELTQKQLELRGQELLQLHQIKSFLRLQSNGVLEAWTSIMVSLKIA